MILTDPFIYEFDTPTASEYDKMLVIRWFVGHECERCGCLPQVRSYKPNIPNWMFALKEMRVFTWYAHPLQEYRYTDPAQWHNLPLEYCQSTLRMREGASKFLERSLEWYNSQEQKDETVTSQVCTSFVACERRLRRCACMVSIVSNG